MNILGLTLIIVGAIVMVATALCIVLYGIVTINELVERFMERYFPAKYYYDWEDGIE